MDNSTKLSSKLADFSKQKLKHIEEIDEIGTFDGNIQCEPKSIGDVISVLRQMWAHNIFLPPVMPQLFSFMKDAQDDGIAFPLLLLTQSFINQDLSPDPMKIVSKFWWDWEEDYLVACRTRYLQWAAPLCPELLPVERLPAFLIQLEKLANNTNTWLASSNWRKASRACFLLSEDVFYDEFKLRLLSMAIYLNNRHCSESVEWRIYQTRLSTHFALHSLQEILLPETHDRENRLQLCRLSLSNTVERDLFDNVLRLNGLESNPFTLSWPCISKCEQLFQQLFLNDLSHDPQLWSKSLKCLRKLALKFQTKMERHHQRECSTKDSLHAQLNRICLMFAAFPLNSKLQIEILPLMPLGMGQPFLEAILPQLKQLVFNLPKYPEILQQHLSTLPRMLKTMLHQNNLTYAPRHIHSPLDA